MGQTIDRIRRAGRLREALRPVIEPAAVAAGVSEVDAQVLRWADRQARAQRVYHESGYVDLTAELTMCALLAAVADYRRDAASTNAANAIRAALLEHVRLYGGAATGWKARHVPSTGAESCVDYGAVLDQAAKGIGALVIDLQKMFFDQF